MTGSSESDPTEKTTWTVKFHPPHRKRVGEYHHERGRLPQEADSENKQYSATIHELCLKGLDVEENDIDIDAIAEQQEEYKSRISELESENEEVRQAYENPSISTVIQVIRGSAAFTTFFTGALAVVVSLFFFAILLVASEAGVIQAGPEWDPVVLFSLFGVGVGLFMILLSPLTPILERAIETVRG